MEVMTSLPPSGGSCYGDFFSSENAMVHHELSMLTKPKDNKVLTHQAFVFKRNAEEMKKKKKYLTIKVEGVNKKLEETDKDVRLSRKVLQHFKRRWRSPRPKLS
ncbi:hypothetical protein VNO80_07551 [Phaseolus coccineus]|uniref:Uncharacterized protein n=1 Tax=Phaseolus coccineus TaxID=3886 RepID=A0AAN9NKC6_PHACN